ncbi:MAG: hypothetical protein JXB49_15595 [Bacteroidales bacterium]|nr:hypothetical protein [Bacteroidales bacterium]
MKNTEDLQETLKFIEDVKSGEYSAEEIETVTFPRADEALGFMESDEVVTYESMSN